jgi:hypothetical protein
MKSPADSHRQAWFITSRWSELEGELRAAVWRIAFVIAFYAVQLVHYLFLAEPSGAELLFQRQVTYVAAAWLFVSLTVMIAVTQRWFPPALKFVGSGCDVALLTAAAHIGNGPASPLVHIYAIIIVMAGLRMSLSLIWFTTIACLVGYLALVAAADAVWFDPDHVTPPVTTIVTLLSLSAVGLIVGQIIRMGRKAAEQYVTRRAFAANQGNES